MIVVKNLEKNLEQPFALPVYYFASTQDVLLRQAADKTCKALLSQNHGAEVTRCDGPEPDIAQVIAAAGVISFFGTPRVVEVREIQPQSMKDKDAAELALLFNQLENAVLVVTCLYKDKKTASSKKAKLMFEAAAKVGFAAVLEKPTRSEYLNFLRICAEKQGASFAAGAAEELLERAGDSLALLESETAKLAAFSGYGIINKNIVISYGVQNLEADIFQLTSLITAGKKAQAQEKLKELIYLKNEPVLIAGAMAGTFVDMYRVRIGTQTKKNQGEIAEDFAYTNSYRVQKAKENAAKYSTKALRQCLFCLANLDKELKSGALQDKSVLLQTAVAQLVLFAQGQINK